MRARVCVLMGGHVSTCPRMVKAADSLAEAGYDVRVVSTRYVPWADRTDEHELAIRKGRWRWDPIDLRSWRARLSVGLRRRIARAVVARTDAPLRLAAMAYARGDDALARKAAAEPFDLLYAGTGIAIAAAARVARRARRPFAIDLEDLHTDEQHDSASARLDHEAARRVVVDAAKDAAFVTTSSRAIADAYERMLGRRPDVLHNVFTLPPEAADRTHKPFRVGWFSQTIGQGRGIELAIRALGRDARPAILELRGTPATGMRERLASLRDRVAPMLTIEWKPPTSPSELIATLAALDVGLALEPGRPLNNDLLLSNKALSYPLVGVPIALTATRGNAEIIAALGEAAIVVPTSSPEDERVRVLADGLGRWHASPERHAKARAAARAAATSRWRWDHPDEEGRLLELVERALR